MGHPEALTSFDANLQMRDQDINTPINDTGNLPKLLNFNSQGINLFPELGSLGSVNSITHLYLNFNNLNVIPSDINETLPNLQVFSIIGNEISELPASIGNLKFLRELLVCDNRITLLPKSLCKLTQLTIFKASQNGLKALHAEIGQNEFLEVLDVSNNALTRFPATLGLLKSLRVLNARKNQLEHIPPTIYFLKSLHVVDFSSNQLKSIPDSFSLLENLQRVDVSENQISTLWSNCASLHCLEKINMNCNSITFLPSWFSHLNNVSEMSAAYNNLGQSDSFPSDFGQELQRLRRLDLRGNRLEKLPPGFCSLSFLEIVLLGSGEKNSERQGSIHGNWLNALPKDFCNLKQIVSLAAEDNQLTYLPEDFGSLVLLRDLYLGGNLLTSLPKSFYQLKSLEKCQLSSNKLRRLSEDFGFLNKLKELHLDCNKLKSLPSTLKDCAHLEVLDLRGNRFRDADTHHSIMNAFAHINILRLFKESSNQGAGDGYSTSGNFNVNNEGCEMEGDDIEEAFAGYSDDENNFERESTSPSDVSEACALGLCEEENWDENGDDTMAKPQISPSKSESEFEAGQFELDGDDDQGNKNQGSALKFDFYGNASQRIDLSISQHRMLPYLLHQPRQLLGWQKEACEQEEDQFDDPPDIVPVDDLKLSSELEAMKI